jgi:hypothetical protein
VTVLSGLEHGGVLTQPLRASATQTPPLQSPNHRNGRLGRLVDLFYMEVAGYAVPSAGVVSAFSAAAMVSHDKYITARPEWQADSVQQRASMPTGAYHNAAQARHLLQARNSSSLYIIAAL